MCLDFFAHVSSSSLRTPTTEQGYPLGECGLRRLRVEVAFLTPPLFRTKRLVFSSGEAFRVEGFEDLLPVDSLGCFLWLPLLRFSLDFLGLKSVGSLH